MYLLKWTSDSDFNKRGFIIQIEWTKAICNIANPCSKLLCTEVREVYQIFRNQTLVFSPLNDKTV